MNAYIMRTTAQVFEVAFFLTIFKSLIPEEIGLFSLGLAISVFLALFLDLGINTIIVREINKKNTSFNTLVINSILIRIPIFIFATALYIFWIIIDEKNYALQMTVFWACMIQIITIFENMILSYLRAIERQTASNALILLNSALKLLVGCFFIIYFRIQDSYRLLETLFFIKCVVLIADWLGYMKYRILLPKNSAGCTRLEEIKDMIRSSLSFFGINCLTALQNRLDWILVSFFTGTISLAGYSLGNKLYEFMQGFGGFALITIFPYMCRTPKYSTRMELLTKLGFLFFSSVAIIVSLVGYDILFLLWGDKYEESKIIIFILLYGFPLSYLSGIFYHYLVAHDLEFPVFKILMIATLSSILFDLFFIPRLGAIGAALGMLVLWFITALGNTILCIKEKLAQPNFLYSLGWPVLILWTLAAILYKAPFAISAIIILLASIMLVTLCTSWEDRRFIVTTIRSVF